MDSATVVSPYDTAGQLGPKGSAVFSCAEKQRFSRALAAARPPTDTTSEATTTEEAIASGKFITIAMFCLATSTSALGVGAFHVLLMLKKYYDVV